MVRKGGHKAGKGRGELAVWWGHIGLSCAAGVLNIGLGVHRVEERSGSGKARLRFTGGSGVRLPCGARDEAEDTDEADADQGHGGEELLCGGRGERDND